MKRIIKLCNLALCLALMLSVMAGCGGGKQADPFAKSGISSVKVTKDGEVIVQVTLSAQALEDHGKEEILLYELLPGEGVEAVAGKEPLGKKKAAAGVAFTFPVEAENNSRLYSSFVATFEDGSAIAAAKGVQNPEDIAPDRAAFAWTSLQKGLWNADADTATDLGVEHILYTIPYAELTAGNDEFTFNGNTYRYNENALAAREAQIKKSAGAGVQVTLSLTFAAVPAAGELTAMFDLLAARYAGKVSAWTLHCGEAVSASEAATMCRYASLALRSRTAAARIYVSAPTAPLDETKLFFSDLSLALAATGTVEWGAAVQADVGEKTVTPDGFSDLSEFLNQLTGTGSPSRWAVTLPALDAEDETRQAALLAYAYRLALDADAGMIFYAPLYEDSCGLFSAEGVRRPSAEMFANIDRGLSYEQQTLCKEFLGDAWASLDKPLQDLHEELRGVANLGTVSTADDSLFDFTAGETHGFVGVGTLSEPITKTSAAWGTPVLYTQLDPASRTPAGVRNRLPDGSALAGASSLSVHLLTQLADASEAPTVTLTLEGVSASGTRLHFTSDITVTDRQWQVVTFQISAFVARMDATKPVTVTLTATQPAPPTEDTSEDAADTAEPTEPSDTDASEQHDEQLTESAAPAKPSVLWVRSMDLRRPDSNSNPALLPLILGGVALTFAVFFAIYLIRSKRKRK